MCDLCKEEKCNLVALIELIQEMECVEDNHLGEYVVYDKDGNEVQL